MSKRKLTRDEITLTFGKDKEGRLVVVAGIYEENGWRSYKKFFLNELPNEKVTTDDLASVGIEKAPDKRRAPASGAGSATGAFMQGFPPVVLGGTGKRKI